MREEEQRERERTTKMAKKKEDKKRTNPELFVTRTMQNSYFWRLLLFSSILIEITSNFRGVLRNIHARGIHTPITATISLPSSVVSSRSWGITSVYSVKYRRHGDMMMELAPRMKPRAQNVPGNLFVDEGDTTTHKL
jgi:hypothetical protein